MKKSKNFLNYSQPDFYKFSRDSIELAEMAAKYERENKSINVLELFAGSGVVSIEFESRHPSVDSVTFIEIQEEFKDHLESNAKFLNATHSINFLNFKLFKSPIKYNVILLNPPYFDIEKSRLGDNENRNLCRFNLNFKFSDIISSLEAHLSNDGSAYICHSDELDKIDTRIIKIGEYQSVGLFRFRLNID